MNWKKEMKNIVSECVKRIEDAVRESIAEEYEWAMCTVDTNDGYISLAYYEDGKCDVEIWHDNDRGKVSPLLENWLEKELRSCVDWDTFTNESESRPSDDWLVMSYTNLMKDE